MAEPCWEWTRGTNGNGYGSIRLHQTGFLMNRASLEAHTGERIPEGINALHACDNPPCVNPAHLGAGTKQENHHDAIARGRKVQVRGEQVAAHKLTEAQVREIKRLIREGQMSLRAIARHYGMNHTVIQRIAHGRYWAHVTEESA